MQRQTMTEFEESVAFDFDDPDFAPSFQIDRLGEYFVYSLF